MRRIDVDAALERFQEVYCSACDNHNGVLCRACAMLDGFNIADEMPTIQTESDHGYWIDDGMYGGNIMCHCSNCHGTERGHFSFCHWCGARMDGGD